MNRFTLLAITLILLPSFALANSNKENYQKFGHLRMVSKATVSPDGQFIAAIYNSENGPAITVTPFGTSDMQVVVKLKKSQDRIDRVHWINNERLLVSASHSFTSYGIRTRLSRLFAVDKDGGELLEIRRKYPKDAADWEKRIEPRFLSSLPQDKEHI